MRRRCPGGILLAFVLLLNGVAPRTTVAGAAGAASCFAPIGFCVEGRLLAYWESHGGLALNGYPLSGERREILEDGREYAAQDFERVRMEYHPEKSAPNDALLGQFGRRILAEADLLTGTPNPNQLYLGSARVQTLVGRPLGPAVRAPGSYRSFERGAMLWRGDTRAIYVLCGGDRRAGDNVPGPFADTWREGDAPDGGSGPGTGLYEPGRGFGKLWREDAEVRACLTRRASAACRRTSLFAQRCR